MRETMSRTSSGVRPATSASKYRGASKIWSRASATWPSLTSRWSEPSPSTRVRFWTWKRRSPECIALVLSCVALRARRWRAPARGRLGRELRAAGGRGPERDDGPAAEAVGDPAEDGRRAREAGKQATDILGGEAAGAGPGREPGRERVDVGVLARTEAAVAAAPHARADRA